MNIDIRSFDDVHLSGDHATRSPAPRSPRHAALLPLQGAAQPEAGPVRAVQGRAGALGAAALTLAGISPLRPRALPGTAITALASVFNYRFQVEKFSVVRLAFGVRRMAAMRRARKMASRKALNGFAALIVLAYPALAPAQDFLPPAEHVQTAIQSYAEVRAAGAALTQERESARALAASPHDPQLSFATVRRRNLDDGPPAKYYTEWDLVLSRTLRLPGKAALDEETGARAVAAAEFRHGDAKHQAARTLLAAWMGWLRAEAEAAAAQTRLDSLQRERAILARRLALGDAAQREIDQIDAALASVRAEHQQTLAAVQAQRLMLDSSFPQIPVPVRALVLPAPEPLPGTAQDWTQRIVAHNHELGALKETAAQHDALARRAEAERRPDPTVGVRTFSEHAGRERGVGVMLIVPFGGERRDAQARSQFAAAEAARQQTEAMYRDVLREAQLAVTRAQLSLSLWQAARDARDANAASLARQRRAYELGEIGLAERLQTERLDADAALAELRARADAHEALLRVQVDGHALWDWDEEAELPKSDH